jgi:hypothetical protein
MAYAITFAENECYETRFPANNPVKGVPEIICQNPLSPNVQSSYWSTHIAGEFKGARADLAGTTVEAVERLYRAWATRFKKSPELHVDYQRAYFVGGGVLTRNAGLLQIRDYADHAGDEELLALYREVQQSLASLKAAFHEFIVSKAGLDYFGAGAGNARLVEPLQPKSDFERVVEKRVALASAVVDELHMQKNFGRTKLAKIFYLADASLDLGLDTTYVRQAAGPLDVRALYHKRNGIEAVARRHAYFTEDAVEAQRGAMIRYQPGANVKAGVDAAKRLFGTKYGQLRALIDLLRDMDTEQVEIVATLYASWNDLLLKGEPPSDDEIIDDVRTHWHERKKRFTKQRLQAALGWMRGKNLVPKGVGRRTRRGPVAS